MVVIVIVISVNPGGGLGVATPKCLAGVVGSQGVVGVRERVTEGTLESVFFVFFIRKREKLAKNVGVKGEIFLEKRQFLENWKFFGWNRKQFLRLDSRPQTSNQ